MINRCDYAGSRHDALMDYLYGELEPCEAVVFESHLTQCAVCREEVAALRGVRAELRMWTPPAADPIVTVPAEGIFHSHWWHQIPGWAQVGAAFLCLGVAVGIANVNVQYGAGTVTVRTGWFRGGSPEALTQAPLSKTTVMPITADAPWRGDLTAVERQLRRDFQLLGGGASRTAAASSPSNPLSNEDIVKRVRALVAESERKQERELALRIAEVFRDVQAQRQADLVKIDRSLSLLQNNTGIEVMRQRQLINSLAVRVSQKQ